jgi:two-component system cell cycle sensor histidine kinase/response regulator CckA
VLPVSAWRRVGAVLLAAGIVGAVALWYLATRLPPIPRRPLRIGFESNPPVQIRTENGFSGLAVETVNEAAKRAGIKLEWIETGTSSDEAFRKGLVDLWPLMVDFPDRRKRVHFARPWMHSSDVLLLRDGSLNPDRRFKGRIAVFKLPLHVRLAQEQFPEAHIVVVPDIEDIIKQVCKGAEAGFLEARVALTLLREKSKECPSQTFRVQTVAGLVFDAGVASTFESAGAADQIQSEIDNMFRSGNLAVLIAKYNYFGLDDTWASYEKISESDAEMRRPNRSWRVDETYIKVAGNWTYLYRAVDSAGRDDQVHVVAQVRPARGEAVPALGVVRWRSVAERYQCGRSSRLRQRHRRVEGVG